MTFWLIECKKSLISSKKSNYNQNQIWYNWIFLLINFHSRIKVFFLFGSIGKAQNHAQLWNFITWIILFGCSQYCALSSLAFLMFNYEYDCQQVVIIPWRQIFFCNSIKTLFIILLSNLIYYIFGKGENCETCSWW